jgi:hypothetical protein
MALVIAAIPERAIVQWGWDAPVETYHHRTLDPADHVIRSALFGAWWGSRATAYSLRRGVSTLWQWSGRAGAVLARPLERVLLSYAHASQRRYADFDLMLPQHEVLAAAGDVGYERAEEEDELGEGGDGSTVSEAHSAGSHDEVPALCSGSDSEGPLVPPGFHRLATTSSSSTFMHSDADSSSGVSIPMHSRSSSRGPAARRVARRYKLVADPYGDSGELRCGYTSGLVQAARCQGFSRTRTAANEAAVRAWLVREMVAHGVRTTHIHRHVDTMVVNVFRVTEQDRRLAWADWWGTRILGTFKSRGRAVA